MPNNNNDDDIDIGNVEEIESTLDELEKEEEGEDNDNDTNVEEETTAQPSPKSNKSLYPHSGRQKSFTLLERRFVRFYFVFNGNRTKAAKAAGYSNAPVAGCNLMKRPHVKAAIEAMAGHHLEASGLNPYRVLEELRRLALFDPKELYDRDGNLKHIRDLPDEVASAISQIDMSTALDPALGPVSRIKYKTHDKRGALETALKFMNLLPTKLEVSGDISTGNETVDWFEYCTVEEKEVIHGIMMKARERMSDQGED
jgi:phage terminase small subunit